MISFAEFRESEYSCPKCDWKGIGKNAESGVLLELLCIDVLCPKCYECLGIRAMPTIEDRISLGNTEDEAKRIQNGIRDSVAEAAERYNRLPDIDESEIIITLHEEEKFAGSYEGDIVLSWNGKEFWRESRGFEYYTRYLNIAKFLKKKYDARLFDFEAEYTWALGGDSSSAIDKVRKFRKTLSNRSELSDDEFDFATKSGRFNPKESKFWKALEFAKERHSGQRRNEGNLSFEHITGVIEILRRFGYTYDYILTIAALHDIFENTETTKDEIYDLLCKHPDETTIAEFARLYNCDQAGGKDMYDLLNNSDCRDIIAEIELLTHRGENSFKEYIDRIFDDDSIKREGGLFGQCCNNAKIVKLAAILHNLTTLHLCGEPEKIQREIREAEKCIMPLRDNNKNCEALFNQIEMQLEILKAMN